jgi:hypothetical protein
MGIEIMTSTNTTAAWNSGYAAGVTGQRPSRRSDYTDAQQAAYIEGYTEAAAYMLGIHHGTEGIELFGDLRDAGSALLMNALGQTGPTTGANHAHRLALVDAYSDGLRAGRQVTA